MIYYSKTHEYIRVENEPEGFIGISAYAAKQLGNVVYVDLPEEGDEFSAGEDFGAIESVKAASDLFAPVDMEVTEVNDALADDPSLVSKDPMTNYMIKVLITDVHHLQDLMTEEQYAEFCSKEH